MREVHVSLHNFVQFNGGGSLMTSINKCFLLVEGSITSQAHLHQQHSREGRRRTLWRTSGTGL